jgi:predicted dehydrogenase
MSAAVRCAVIGVGMIGREHLRALRSSPLADVVVCCDPHPDAAAHVPPDVPLVADLAEALAAPGLEAVFVCTPQHLHRMVCERALDQGLAVFCEKPIAHTLADGDAMIAAAARSGRLLAIGHTLRFDPDYVAVRDAVAAGDVGRVVSMAARRNVPDFEGRIIAPRTTLAIEVLVHDLDVLRWMAGDIDRIWAEESRQGVLGDGLADAVVATVRMRSGAVATLESNWVMASARGAASDYRFSVVGSEGSAYAEYLAAPVAVFGSTTRFPRTGWLAEIHGVHAGVLRVQDEHFLRCVRTGDPWPVSLADARAALAAALALDASIAAGAPVAVDPVVS